MAFPIPSNEAARLAELRELGILDTAPEQMYDDVVALAAAICRTPIAMINFVDEDRQWGKALIGLESSESTREASFCARTIVQDDVMVVPDALADPNWSGNAQVTGDPNLRFYAGAPIVDGAGHALGSVCVADREARTLDASQLEALSILARQTAAHLELRRLAVHDALTGLPNRTLLFDRLTQALAQRGRAGADVGVLFCDLDNFKAVNDRQGHEAGDDVLRAVARQLQELARAGDSVARLAGDEFVVVCPGLADPGDLDLIAARMHAALDVSVSIGTAIARDGDDADGLLARADAAMYVAKRASA